MKDCELGLVSWSAGGPWYSLSYYLSFWQFMNLKTSKNIEWQKNTAVFTPNKTK